MSKTMRKKQKRCIAFLCVLSLLCSFFVPESSIKREVHGQDDGAVGNAAQERTTTAEQITTQDMIVLSSEEKAELLAKTTQVFALDENNNDFQGVHYALDTVDYTATVGDSKLGKNSAGYMGANDGVVVIPSCISKGGTIYEVNGIDKDAFADNSYIDTVIYPEVIYRKPVSAFAGSTLKRVYFSNEEMLWESAKWLLGAMDVIQIDWLVELSTFHDVSCFQFMDGVLYHDYVKGQKGVGNSAIVYACPCRGLDGDGKFYVPSEMEFVCEYAFAYSNFQNIIFSSSQVCLLKDHCFHQAKVVGLNLRAAIYGGDRVIEDLPQLRWLRFGDGSDIGTSIINCPSLLAVYIPSQSWCYTIRDCENLHFLVCTEKNGVTYTQDVYDCYNLKRVIISEKVEHLPGSFCNNENSDPMDMIYVPNSVKDIFYGAFDSKLGHLTKVYGDAGSAAERYCNESGFPFVNTIRHNHNVDALTTELIYQNAYMKVEGKICKYCGYVPLNEYTEEPDVVVTYADNIYDIGIDDTEYIMPLLEMESTTTTEATTTEVDTEQVTESTTTITEQVTENTTATTEQDTQTTTEDVENTTAQTTQIVPTTQPLGEDKTTQQNPTTQTAPSGSKTTQASGSTQAAPNDNKTTEDQMQQSKMETFKKETVLGLSATTKTGKSIVLKWNANDRAGQYKIYRSTSKSGSYKCIATVEKTTYTDKTVKQNKTYYYKIAMQQRFGSTVCIGSYSDSKSYAVYKLKEPKIVVRKKVNSDGIKYLQIDLKNMSGSNIELYVKQGAKKYKKVRLQSDALKNHKKNLKIQYTMKNVKLKLKLRTYKRYKGKKVFSPYSKEVSLKV